MSYLIDQPSFAPTRKWNAAAIASAITIAIIAGVNQYWPGVGDTLAPIVEQAITAMVSADAKATAFHLFVGAKDGWSIR